MKAAGEALNKRQSRKLLLLLALVPAVLLGLELSFRGYQVVRGEAYDAQALRVELLAAVDAMTQPLPTAPEDLTAAALKSRSTQVVHPFLGFDTEAGVRGITPLVRELSRSAGPERFVVLVVGGSVSGMVSKNGADALRETLAADPRFEGVEIVIKNQGRGSFKQPQQLMVVAWLLSLGIQPDAIVNIDGFNEVALGAENLRLGVHPSYPHWPRWGFLTSSAALDEIGIRLTTTVYTLQERVRTKVQRALNGGFLRSAILGRKVQREVARMRGEWTRTQAELVEHLARASEGDAAKGPAFGGAQELGLQSIARAWMEASRNLQALCAARGIAYVHVLQPTLFDEGSKPLTAGEQRIAEAGHPAMAASVRAGYPLLRAGGEKLEGEGISFVDATPLFSEIEDPLYVDICHFRPRGCALVGRAIGEALLEELP